MITALSIIIPCLNEEAYLPRLLESIVAQTYTGKLQVIVVDGESDDKTVSAAKNFHDHLPDLAVLSTQRDIGTQRNAGAQHARYEHILFLDADVILPPNVLHDLLSKVDPQEQIIACTLHTAEHMSFGDYCAVSVAYFLLFLARLARMPAISGDFMLTTRTNHQKIHGFAEGAIMGEDSDYALRSVRAGAHYRYFFRPVMITSDRRVRQVGKWRLILLWARAYLHVLKHGPIFPGQGFEYPFGHYDLISKKQDRRT